MCVCLPTFQFTDNVCVSSTHLVQFLSLTGRSVASLFVYRDNRRQNEAWRKVSDVVGLSGECRLL